MELDPEDFRRKARSLAAASGTELEEHIMRALLLERATAFLDAAAITEDFQLALKFREKAAEIHAITGRGFPALPIDTPM